MSDDASPRPHTCLLCGATFTGFWAERQMVDHAREHEARFLHGLGRQALLGWTEGDRRWLEKAGISPLDGLSELDTPDDVS